MGKITSKPVVSVDDILIDASGMLKWVDELQATGIEPPPVVFQLKRHLAGIPIRRPRS